MKVFTSSPINILSIVAAATILFPTKALGQQNINLQNYLSSDQDSYKLLMSGDAIPQNSPVYFDIASQDNVIGGETNYVLDDIRVPESVDGVNCWEGEEISCHLVIGFTKFCASSSTTQNCDMTTATCVCTVADSGEGGVTDSCGQSSPDWNTVCQDATPRVNESDATMGVVLSFCPSDLDSANYCGYCAGGPMPDIRVGLEWTSNEQDCIFNPFDPSSAFPSNILASAMIAIVVGSLAAIFL